MPELTTMPKLKVLNLNANNIKELKLVCGETNYVHMKTLLVRNNKIRFKGNQMDRFIQKLKNFKGLSTLNLDSNPFESQADLMKRISENLPQCVEMFNNARR